MFKNTHSNSWYFLSDIRLLNEVARQDNILQVWPGCEHQGGTKTDVSNFCFPGWILQESNMEANITLIPSTSNRFFHRLLDYCRKQRVCDAYTLSSQTDAKLKCKSMARTKMLMSGCKWNTQGWNDFNIISTKGPRQLLRSSHFLINTL